VDDYLSESEKWEAIKVWLRENTLWILAGVLVGGAAIGGWRWYQDHVDTQALTAGAKYQSVIASLANGDATAASVLLGAMERDDAASPYLDQAKLAVARFYVESGDLPKAVTQLQSVVDHARDKDLALVARLRLARVQIAQNKPDDALTTLNAIPQGAFPALVHDVRGDAYHAKGDKPSALKEYQLARTADLAGVTDTQLLDLKITDLLADAGTTSKPTQPPAAAAAK
jgi:predicted negative regulator of RcsB-dependent stress response